MNDSSNLSVIPIRGIVVCVNYDDLLKITLVRNMRHLSECLVVTSPADHRTKELCKGIPNVRVYETDAFYRYGAKFNKGLAMEEGFDMLGRSGWILIWDADTLLPDNISYDYKPGNLYNAHRLILNDPLQWTPEFDWKRATPSHDPSFPGYFQLFYAEDPIISQHPWYDVTFTHAGGCDGYFQSRWPQDRKIRLPFKVLHLGPRDTNWFGRASERADRLLVEEQAHFKKEMQKFLTFKGWRGANSSTFVEPNYNEKVAVPGAVETGYKLTGKYDRNKPAG